MKILKIVVTVNTFLMSMLGLRAQYAPGPGFDGSTAIFKDSSIFKTWATSCTVKRGWIDVRDTALGRVEVGEAENATGKAGEKPIVSLGDGGEAILQFATPIFNGQGPDFAVFENGFAYAFKEHFYYLELAFVEVSSDGVHYFRFPAISENDTLEQIDGRGTAPDGGIMDCRKVHNFAGKYPLFYGVPFDLEELKNEKGLDVMNITHVKIVDVVGSLNPAFGTRDSRGFPVNDPFPTPFPSSGFDLDAVGVIHARALQVRSLLPDGRIACWPNPVLQGAMPSFAEGLSDIEVYSLQGEKLGNEQHIPALLAGFYFIHWNFQGLSGRTRLIIQ